MKTEMNFSLSPISSELSGVEQSYQATPQLNGVEATVRITREMPETKVMILTTYGSADDIGRALEAGAAGADDSVVVGDEDLDLLRFLLHVLFSIFMSTRVPRPGALSIFILPSVNVIGKAGFK